MDARLLSISLSVLMLFLIIELVRRERLTFKYAAGWLLVSVAGILLAVFEGVLHAVARFLGFALLSNFVFFAILVGFVFLSLLLTILLCQQNDRNDRLAQLVGMLENKVRRLEQQGAAGHPDPGAK